MTVFQLRQLPQFCKRHLFIWLMVISWLGFAEVSRAQPQPVTFVSGTVRYTASDANATWQGDAPIASLNWDVNLDHLPAVMLEVRMNPADFNSGNIIRDTNARRSVFNVRRHPEIIFVGERFVATSTRLQDGNTLTGNVSGTLTMHGISQEVNLPVTLTRDGTELEVSSEFSVLLSDYEMTRPSFLGVQVDDEVRLEVVLVGQMSFDL
jgi:polyisoprenoid-binding protein YceI